MWTERLAEHLKDRTAQLEKARGGGKKIIGYFPGDYVPEELIVAAGAVPLCLISAGDASSLEASLAAIPNLFCPFARTQVGEKLLKRDPYYRMVDMLVAPITCQHLKKTAEIWEYHGEGRPHQDARGRWNEQSYRGGLDSVRGERGNGHLPEHA